MFVSPWACHYYNHHLVNEINAGDDIDFLLCQRLKSSFDQLMPNDYVFMGVLVINWGLEMMFVPKAVSTTLTF